MSSFWEQILEEFRKRRRKLLEMGGSAAVEKQHARNKLTARERIEYLFDPDTFIEYGLWVKHRQSVFGMDKVEVPAEGVVTGVGRINGRKVAVAAEDYTSMAGTFGEYHGKKFAYIVDFARDIGVPFVGLNDSGGARLQEGMDSLEAYGWLFKSQILASGVIPQIAVIMGPVFGGQAYHPVMQDFLIQVKGTGLYGIAGPAFVKTQLGEEISVEELAGWRAHAVKSGQTDIVAEDDEDALDQTKLLLSFLPSNNSERPPRIKTGDDPERKLDGIEGLVPPEPSKPYDIKKVIEMIVDGGFMLEVKRYFAPNVFTGFTRIDGRVVGVIATNPKYMAGGIDVNGSDKIARFARFCDLFNIPLLYIHDTPGYWIGSDQEWRGILRHGSKMLFACADATVPKVVLIVRKSFAGAYLGMCSKGMGADLVFAWPSAKIGLVGGSTAASVIFAKEVARSSNPEETFRKRVKEYEDYWINPYKAAERGYVDDVIEPDDTRRILVKAIDVLETKYEKAIAAGILRPEKKYSNITL